VGVRCEDGQALVEFALVLPIVVIIIFGIASFGFALNGWNDETHLVSEAARCAAVNSDCTGKEVQFTGGVYEVDEVSVGKATAGTIVLSFKWNGVVYKTASIAYNASATTVAAAVQAAKGTGGETLPASCVKGAGELKTAVKLTFEGSCTGPVTEQTITPTGLTAGTPSFKRATPGEYGKPTAFLQWITEQGDSAQVKSATATICSPTSKIGDYVEIKMKYTYNWFNTSTVFGLFGHKLSATTPITSTAQMRIEVPPSTPYPTTC
jgi:Flp pilus assembly protein TadG